MKHSTGKPTKAHVARFEKLHNIGCICCLKLGMHRTPEIHHIVEGSRRLGHEFTLPLCPSHHRFQSIKALPFGPSIADGTKLFHAHWGTQRELLEEVNRLIA